MQPSKTCKTCGETKPLTEYHPHANMADGYLSKCKTCKIASNREYALANRHKTRAWKAKYKRTPAGKAVEKRRGERYRASEWGQAQYKTKNANRTAKRRNQPERLHPEDWLEVVKRQLGTCAQCNEAPIEEIDHILAFCLGGRNTPENIQGLCQVCHRHKSYQERKLRLERLKETRDAA